MGKLSSDHILAFRRRACDDARAMFSSEPCLSNSRMPNERLFPSALGLAIMRLKCGTDRRDEAKVAGTLAAGTRASKVAAEVRANAEQSRASLEIAAHSRDTPLKNQDRD